MADVIDLKPVFKADFVISPDVTYTADLTFETATKDHTQLINRDVPDQHPISAITGLEELIPTEASADNQLADKDFVLSSIPEFLGVFPSISALEAYTGTVTNNDHVFVENRIVDNNGTYWNTMEELEAYDKSLLTNFDYAFVHNGYDYDVYRFNITTQEWEYYVETEEIDNRYIMTVYNSYKAVVQNGTVNWVYEYTIENNELTYMQWEALQSGVTTDTVRLASSAVQPEDLGNATITITQGGVTKGTFTTNQKGDATIELDSGGGSVTDVTVDGVSVMNGTVAEIDLKTINNESLLGSGNIEIQGGSSSSYIGTFIYPDLLNYTGTVNSSDYCFVENRWISNGTDGVDFWNYDPDLLVQGDCAYEFNGYDYDLYVWNYETKEWEFGSEVDTNDLRIFNRLYNMYQAVVTSGVITWEYKFSLSNPNFDLNQFEALNSGATKPVIQRAWNSVQVGDNISKLVNDVGYVTNITAGGNPLIEVTTVNGVVSLAPKTYVHEQSIASDTWEITHNLGKYPSVTLVDSAGTVFEGAIAYDDLNKCTIQINGASTGKAFLN